MDIFDRVKKIILNQIDIEESKITLNSGFLDDLGADSLDVAEMIMAFEEEFKLEINDEDIEKIKTVGHVVDYFKEK
ncbi:acyl carrier protein [Alkalibaculum sp. M08DMB]|uniref:Acyl carrier protein n=1 Tax=Alkalibaculum sporogenes TaxID=2655001 RepID=A0A6A7K9I7_9FIRM|nr:acyl carrier protein [Alkalibaculum sporogenes]MPW26052.1 acyl carrier protein [Alkalibaculum sporogenes]